MLKDCEKSDKLLSMPRKLELQLRKTQILLERLQLLKLKPIERLQKLKREKLKRKRLLNHFKKSKRNAVMQLMLKERRKLTLKLPRSKSVRMPKLRTENR